MVILLGNRDACHLWLPFIKAISQSNTRMYVHSRVSSSVFELVCTGALHLAWGQSQQGRTRVLLLEHLNIDHVFVDAVCLHCTKLALL